MAGPVDVKMRATAVVPSATVRAAVYMLLIINFFPLWISWRELRRLRDLRESPLHFQYVTWVHLSDLGFLWAVLGGWVQCSRVGSHPGTLAGQGK